MSAAEDPTPQSDPKTAEPPEPASADVTLPAAWHPDRASPEQVESGLLFSNLFNLWNQESAENALATVDAVVELLIARGILQFSEIAKRRDAIKAKMAEQQRPKVGLAPPDDKYALTPTQVDCEDRVAHCKARCCAFTFNLSIQDLKEGVCQFDYGNPYRIRRGDDGYCVHLDRATRACGVHSQRPSICRTYDCREDRRIWVDYENKVPNPDVDKPMPTG